MTFKRGMVRLWIVIAIVVDLYLAFTLVTSLEAGIPVGATWGRLLLVLAVAHVLWFTSLLAVFWVLEGFRPRK
jgi:hypothetical protein